MPRHWWWWAAQPSIFVQKSTTMLIIGIILAFVGLAYLCWLLFALAVYALPFFAGLSAGLAAYHSGSGPIGAIIVGVVAGAVTVLLGQVAFAIVRSPLIRATVALLFAVPAALAGYHAVLGLAHLATRRGVARCNSSCRRHYRGGDRLATHGGFCPDRCGQGIAADLTSSDLTSSGLLSSQTREGEACRPSLQEGLIGAISL